HEPHGSRIAIVKWKACQQQDRISDNQPVHTESKNQPKQRHVNYGKKDGESVTHIHRTKVKTHFWKINLSANGALRRHIGNMLQMVRVWIIEKISMMTPRTFHNQ